MDPSEEVTRVSSRLREVIRVRNVSQRKLEVELGWGKSYLSQILNGHVDFKLKHLFAVLDKIGVSAEEFFVPLYAGGRVALPGGPATVDEQLLGLMRVILEGAARGKRLSMEELREVAPELVRELEPEGDREAK